MQPDEKLLIEPEETKSVSPSANFSPTLFSRQIPDEKKDCKKVSAVFLSLCFVGMSSFCGDAISQRFYDNQTGWAYGAIVGLVLLILYKKCFIDREVIRPASRGPAP